MKNQKMINFQKIEVEKVLSMKVSARMERQEVIRGNEHLFSLDFCGDEAEKDFQFSIYEMQLQNAEMKIQLAESELKNILEYTYDLLGWVPGLTSQTEYEISTRKNTYQVFKNYAEYMLDSLAPVFNALDEFDPKKEIKTTILPQIRNYQDIFYEAERLSGHKADMYEKRCLAISEKIEPALIIMTRLLEKILNEVFSTSL